MRVCNEMVRFSRKSSATLLGEQTMDGQQPDPFADREAEKYQNPIPSREFIMELLQKRGNPMSYDELVEALELTTPDQLEALRRRLKAMARDGQLMPNRLGAYGLVSNMNLILGRITAHKDGYGFLIPDAGGGDLFLSAKQMQRVFHGDRVLAAVIGTDTKGRREGRIVEIIERNTQEVVGQFLDEGGVSFVQPSGKQFTQDIIIPHGKSLDAKRDRWCRRALWSSPENIAKRLVRLLKFWVSIWRREWKLILRFVVINYPTVGRRLCSMKFANMIKKCQKMI